MQLSHCVGVLLLSVHYGLAAFCGDSAIPFSFEVLPNGQPVLGCTRPACFGWSNSGQPISETSSFYNVNGRPDGFFQPLYNSVNPFQPGDGRRYPEQSANCEPSFGSNSCDGPTQWVGGFAPSLNASGSPLVMQCCTYGPLQSSANRGVAPIHPGEIFAGGEVRENNQPVAFDYVSNIVKRVDANGGTSYDVSVKRLPCPGDPPVPPPQFAQPPPQFAQPPPQFAQPPPQFVQAPPPAPAYVPSAAGYYGGGAGSYFCFTADTLVETISGEKKRMDELKIHDWVLTARGKNVGYAPVNYWLHRVPSQKAEFIKFDLADGKSLKITAKHFIYKGKCTGSTDAIEVNQKSVLAGEVEVGDCLYTRDGNYLVEQEVVSKQVVTEVGIYAPMTSNAKIIVNDVLASCNNVYESQSLTNTFFSNIESMRQTLASIFNYSLDSSETDLPFGTYTIMQMAEIVLPKNIMTL